MCCVEVNDSCSSFRPEIYFFESGAKVAAGILFWVENSGAIDLQFPSIRGI
jgi:hypothetical protein